MTHIIKKAQRGNKEAFITLYDANKQKVFYLCNLLLCDVNAAESACIHVFKCAWQFVLDGKIDSEREFEDFVINKAANHCKNKISKSDTKAFRIPQNKNFMLSSYSFDNCSSEDTFYLLLESLPEIHRFIYVLDAYAEWSVDEIAELLHTKSDIVNLAFDSRKNNFERFSCAVKQEKGITVSLNENEFRDCIFEDERECKVDKSVDSDVHFNLVAILNPIVSAKKKKKLKIALIAGISLILVGLLTWGMVALSLSDKDNSASEESVDDYYDEEEFDDSYYDLAWTSTIEKPTQYAIIDIADYGKITVALDANSAPATVENFVNLSKAGFYDGLTFHRIIDGFMMQGGDPNGDGTGGNVDYSGNEVNVVGEFYYNGYNNLLSHTRGAISMARAEDYDSASSQFFIVHEDCSSSLDASYAVFGFVIDGIDVVDKVCAVAEPTDDNGTIEKSAQPIITSIKIYTPEEYEALDKTAVEETVTVIDAKIAEVSAISTREEKLFLTIYGLCENAADYKITDSAKVDLTKYEETEKLEKYVVDASAKVFEVKDGALVEFDKANIVEGDMIVIYTDAEENVCVIVYHIENSEDKETTESGENEENI